MELVPGDAAPLNAPDARFRYTRGLGPVGVSHNASVGDWDWRRGAFIDRARDGGDVVRGVPRTRLKCDAPAPPTRSEPVA